MKRKSKTVDGEIIEWWIKNNKKSGASGLHKKARKILKSNFSNNLIFEEVAIKPYINSIAYLDFFIPDINFGIEVQGEQHFKFIAHFHKTRFNFAKALTKDKIKKDWCKLNNIHLVYFNYNESIKEWQDKISSLL